MKPTTALPADVIGHWIAGCHLTESADHHADVFDPATGAVTKRVPLASVDDVQAAIDAAAAAFPAWAETTSLNRARVMFRFKELLERHAGDLAAIITAAVSYTHLDVYKRQGQMTSGNPVTDYVRRESCRGFHGREPQ